MAADSKIEWTDHTFNPWEGCQKVGPGCDNCYAEARNARFGGGQAINWGPGAPRRRTSAANWSMPHRWNDQAGAFMAQHGRRQRVFCASLADVFDNAVDPQWRADLFALILATPALDWLLLTKRIGNVSAMLPEAVVGGELPSNVWLGATIVNQAEADRDIPKLLAVPAAKRFLSMEPLLGPVDLTNLVQKSGPGEHHFSALDCDVDPADDEWGGATVNWVIVGGESGPGARPMHPDWARSLRDQCLTAGVPFLFKQHGEWAPGSGDFGGGAFKTAAVDMKGRIVRGGYEVPDYPKGSTSADGWAMVHLAGKKAAGRLLDGREWNEVPHGAA